MTNDETMQYGHLGGAGLPSKGRRSEAGALVADQVAAAGLRHSRAPGAGYAARADLRAGAMEWPCLKVPAAQANRVAARSLSTFAGRMVRAALAIGGGREGEDGGSKMEDGQFAKRPMKTQKLNQIKPN